MSRFILWSETSDDDKIIANANKRISAEGGRSFSREACANLCELHNLTNRFVMTESFQFRACNGI